MFRRVMNLQPIGQLLGSLRRKRLIQARRSVRVQLIRDQHHAHSLAVGSLQQARHELCPIAERAPLGDSYLPHAGERLKRDKHVGHSVAYVLTVVAGPVPGCAAKGGRTSPINCSEVSSMHTCGCFTS